MIYAVPGHPFVAETTCPKIARLARDEGLATVVVEGLSFLEPTFSALDLDPYPSLTLFDAMELSIAHVPGFPPDAPVLVAQIYSRLVASEVKMTLGEAYPDEHPVRLVHAAGTKDELVEDLKLYEIDRSEHIGLLTSLYIPPLGEGSSFEAFQEIVAHLRAPDGCPWDREQTHKSLRTHLLEECYEALECNRCGRCWMVCRKNLVICCCKSFYTPKLPMKTVNSTINTVIKNIHDKIVRRHPHVFGEVQLGWGEGCIAELGKIERSRA